MSDSEVVNSNDIEWCVNNIYPIYREKLDGYSPLDIWSKVVEHGSSVGEAIREDKFDNLIQHLGRTLGWLLVFFAEVRDGTKTKWDILRAPFTVENWDGLNHGHIYSFADVVLYHYPAICPRCIREKCRCALKIERSDKDRQESMAEARLKLKGKSDSVWTTLEHRFEGLYSHDDGAKSFDEIGFHFLEEIGEVATAIRKLHINNTVTLEPESPTTRSLHGQLIEEIADVFSWCTSVIRRINLDLENYCQLCQFGDELEILKNNLSLKWALERTYIMGNDVVCPSCKSKPCKKDCDEF